MQLSHVSHLDYISLLHWVHSRVFLMCSSTQNVQFVHQFAINSKKILVQLKKYQLSIRNPTFYTRLDKVHPTFVDWYVNN